MLFRLILLFVLTVVLPAGAQERDGRGVAGLRAGSFVIRPVLAVETGYDTNIFLADGGGTGTALVALAPGLEIASDWNRHALKLAAGVRAGLFSHDAGDNYFDADLALAGELDINRSARLTARIAFGRGHEARGTDDAPGAAIEPVVFTALDAELGGDLRFGRFRLSPFARHSQLDFGDAALAGGGRDNQDDRDRTENAAGLELGYRIVRGYEAFLRGGVSAVDYAAPIDDTGVNRDSTEVFGAAGLRLQLTRLLEGSLAFGYTWRDYADATLGDAATLSADTALVWSPTRRITVELTLAREFGETTLPGAAGTVESRAAIGLSYELLRTLSLDASGGAAWLEFDGAGRTDHLLDARLGFDWEATRSLTIAPHYRFGLRDSNTPGRDYSVHGFLLTATYRF